MTSAGVHQHAELVRRVDVELDRGAGRQHQLGPEQRGRGPHRRGVPEQRAEEDPGLPAGTASRDGRVVREGGSAVARGGGQHHPQLDPVQRPGVRGGDLGVADAVAGGHQVQLAGAHHRVRAETVAVIDLPGEQPAHRLQPGVRVRRHAHAPGRRDVVRPVVVDEAPGPDQGAAALRQRPAYPHRSRPAERDVAGLHHLDAHRGGSAAGHLAGVLLHVAHRGLIGGSSFPTPLSSGGAAGRRASARRRGCRIRRPRTRPPGDLSPVGRRRAARSGPPRT